MTTTEARPFTLDDPAWTMPCDTWRGLRGCPSKWIAEISPYQLGAMSKRQRAQYNAKNDAEWRVVREWGAKYLAEVERAYDAGEARLDDPRLSRDARDAILSLRVRRADEAKKAAADAARLDAIHDHLTRETAKVGDVVFHPVFRWMRVTKVNRTTCTVRPVNDNGGVFAPNLPFDTLTRRNPNNLTEQPPA